jgi:hypothetical protein
MAAPRFKEIRAGTAGILGTAIFLLVWSVVEAATDTEPKGAPPGTTYQAADEAGAIVTPSDRSTQDH